MTKPPSGKQNGSIPLTTTVNNLFCDTDSSDGRFIYSVILEAPIARTVCLLRERKNGRADG